MTLARESDRAEAVRALLTLGYHLEVSEADYEGARRVPTGRRWSSPRRSGDLPSQVELHASLAQLAVHGADWDAVERATEASARSLAEREGLHRQALLPGPDARRAAAGARARWDDAIRELLHARPRAGRAGRPLGGGLPGLFWLGARAARAAAT